MNRLFEYFNSFSNLLYSSENLHTNIVVIYLTIILISLCIGSFLNVVIYRLPLMLLRDYYAEIEEAQKHKPALPGGVFNLLYPHSSCTNCNAKITARHNIPIISWLLQKGKCHSCKNRISIRYPLVELLCCILTFIVIMKLGLNTKAFFAVLLTWCLLALSFIDYDYKILPDNLLYPVLWMGLIINIDSLFVTLNDAVLGATIGYLSLWSTYLVHKLITGKEGMGHGDFKLLSLFGAWFGMKSILPIILFASIVALVVSLSLAVLGLINLKKPFAFGPFIAIAGWSYMMTSLDFMYIYY